MPGGAGREMEEGPPFAGYWVGRGTIVWYRRGLTRDGQVLKLTRLPVSLVQAVQKNHTRYRLPSRAAPMSPVM